MFKNIKINVYNGDDLVYSKKKIKVAPGEMESVVFKTDRFSGTEKLKFSLEEV